jgi:hypothetical protein
MQQPNADTCTTCTTCTSSGACDCPSRSWPHAPLLKRGKLTATELPERHHSSGCAGPCNQGRLPCVCDHMGPPTHLPSRPFVWFAIGACVVLGALVGVHIILRAG